MNDAPRVLIVGAGWIGRQVGLRMAICGLHVTLVDKHRAVLEAAQQWMLAAGAEYITSITEQARDAALASSLGLAAAASTSKELLPDPASYAQWQQRVSLAESLDKLAETTDVVLECVSEQASLKRRVLREFSARFPKPTIIASNSSYFTPSTLAGYVQAPERFAHWHFHVPLSRASIADVCGHPATEARVLDRLVELSQMIYQYPLRLRHEQPGYVFNWLLQSVLRSALELAARDVASIEDIDRAWRSVSGMPLGPFAMMDHIGLDVIEQCLANARWDTAQGVPIEELLAVLRKPIGQGHLGLKSGQGFYDHS